MKPELLVLAAGIGSRYGGIKQLEPVGANGELLLDYSLFDARRAGIERVVLVIRRELEDDFHCLLEPRHGSDLELAYAFQELDDLPAGLTPPPGRVKPWGTAHAVLAAAPAIRGPFILINADDLYGPEGLVSLAVFLAEHQPGSQETYAMAAYRLENTLSEHGGVSRGVCEVDAHGLLRSVREHTGVARTREGIEGRDAEGVLHRFSGREPVSMNLWGLRRSILPHLADRFERFLATSGGSTTAELYLPQVISELIGEGVATVRVFPTDFPWLGVTHRGDREPVARSLRELIRQGVYPERLWE